MNNNQKKYLVGLLIIGVLLGSMASIQAGVGLPSPNTITKEKTIPQPVADKTPTVKQDLNTLSSEEMMTFLEQYYKNDLHQLKIQNDDMGTLGWPNTVKNIIILIPDGCSQSIQTATRWYTGEPLTLDSMVSGLVATYMIDSVITDSAAAATAFATGHKTSDGMLSVGPSEDIQPFLTGYEPTADPYVPVSTVLEGAKLKGKATGLIATSRISHATPAAYACHIYDRDFDNDIIEHMIYENLDVVFGGGFRHLIPTTMTYTTSFGAAWKGKRTDGENLYQVLLDKGYQVVDNRNDMLNLTTGKAWGLFDDSHMQADIDRALLAPHEPSLAEMTAKAIELLSKDKDGFFLMVEGSQVDWAGHANDPIHMITDFLAFDEAVEVAVDFAKTNGKTLVMAFPDHNCGGFDIGNRATDNTYTSVTIEMLLDPLENMQITSTALGAIIVPSSTTIPTVESIQENVSIWWGLTLSDTQAQEIIDIYNTPTYFNNALNYVVCRDFTVFGWTSNGHTGTDVPLWSYGPNQPTGLYDNTELAEIVEDQFNFNLDFNNLRLFIDVDTVFPGEWTLDSTDPTNLVLEIGDAALPISKNLLYFEGTSYELNGIVVYAPVTGSVYIPLQAVLLIWYLS